MLKLLYTEAGVHIERLPPAEWLILRQALPLTLYGSETTATLLVPRGRWGELNRIPNLSVTIADADYLEVSVEGWWWAAAPESETGIFIAEVSPLLEAILCSSCQEILM